MKTRVMNYQYIEQLLERYWECQTTKEEEAILRTFFLQEDVPASLLPYRPLFAYQQGELAEEVRGESFDERVLAQINAQQVMKVQPQRMTIVSRLQPLFRAVAVVAVVLVLGTAIQPLMVGQDSASDADVTAEVEQVEQSSSFVVMQGDSAMVDRLQR